MGQCGQTIEMRVPTDIYYLPDKTILAVCTLDSDHEGCHEDQVAFIKWELGHRKNIARSTHN